MKAFAEAVIAGFLLVHAPEVSATEACDVALQHGGMTFPVDEINEAARCRMAAIVTRPSISNAIGPFYAPIGEELYAYLLDHPALMSALLEQLEMGAYQFTPDGPDRFLVDDGDGAEGVLTVLARDRASRVYFVDGRHHSRLFPTIGAKTVIFLRLEAGTASQVSPSAQTRVISYTRFDGAADSVARMFRPLVEWAVKKTLLRHFTLTNELAIAIARDPERVRSAVAHIPSIAQDERDRLLLFLQLVPQSASHPSSPVP